MWILFINSARGIGCAMDSLSHCIEDASNSGAIPCFTHYFVSYADFDLDKRYHVPFTSLYGHGSPPVRSPDATTAVVTDNGKEYTLHPYVAAGGNVHYCPGAWQDNDLSDYSVSVMSTIEPYGMHDGLDGKDRAVLCNVKIVDQHAKIAPDCHGR